MNTDGIIMNRYSEIQSWMLLGVVLAAAAACLGQTTAQNDRAEGVYRSAMEGFAVKPPIGGQRASERIPGILAQWSRQDPKTGETMWTLRVYRTTFRNREANIREYAKAVTDSLAMKTGLKVEDLTYMDVAGCPAIQITGSTDGQVVTEATGMETKFPATQLRQAWFLRGPGEFLVLDLASVGKRSDWIDKTWENLLATIELFDANVYLLEQKANTERAQAFLKSLTADAIRSALPRKPRWFLVYKDDSPVGWLCMQGRPARQNKIAGYEICSWAMLQLPDQPVRIIRQEQFTDPELSIGVWKSRIQLGSGDQSALLVEDGLLQGGMIISTFTDGQRQSSEQQIIPKAVKGMYLPKAIGTLMPALLDRTQSAAYTFAEYDRQLNDFQMRTVAVVGPERVNLKGKFVQAIKITDQPKADAEALTLWVDAKGQLLQTRSPDGLMSVSTSQADVLKSFPNARGVIAQMNQTQPGKPAAKGP